MKKIILTICLSIFVVACTSEKETLNAKLASCKLDNFNLEGRVQSLKRYIAEQDSLIQEQQDRISYMQDELQFKESEISYWGHKYDSCMFILKNKNNGKKN